MDDKLKETIQELLDNHTRRVIDQCIGILVQERERIERNLESLKPAPGHKHLCDFEGCDQEPVDNELLCEAHIPPSAYSCTRGRILLSTGRMKSNYLERPIYRGTQLWCWIKRVWR